MDGAAGTQSYIKKKTYLMILHGIKRDIFQIFIFTSVYIALFSMQSPVDPNVFHIHFLINTVTEEGFEANSETCSRSFEFLRFHVHAILKKNKS